MKKPDLHINILEYCNNHLEGFTINELKKDLSLSELEVKFLTEEIGGSDLVARTNKYRSEDNNDFNNEILILSFEGKFKLLEYTELQEARKTAKEAFILAIISIFISSFSFIFEANINILNIIEKPNLSSVLSFSSAIIVLSASFFQWWDITYNGEMITKKWVKFIFSIAIILLIISLITLLI